MFPYLLQSSFSIGSAKELLKVFLDCLGVHRLFGEDQLLDPVFVFQHLRSHWLIRGHGLATLDITRIVRDHWSSSLRVPAL